MNVTAYANTTKTEDRQLCTLSVDLILEGMINDDDYPEITIRFGNTPTVSFDYGGKCTNIDNNNGVYRTTFDYKGQEYAVTVSNITYDGHYAHARVHVEDETTGTPIYDEDLGCKFSEERQQWLLSEES